MCTKNMWWSSLNTLFYINIMDEIIEFQYITFSFSLKETQGILETSLLKVKYRLIEFFK